MRCSCFLSFSLCVCLSLLAGVKDVYTIRVLPSDELSPKPGKAYVIGSTDKDLVDELFQRLKLIAELDLSTSSSK